LERLIFAVSIASFSMPRRLATVRPSRAAGRGADCAPGSMLASLLERLAGYEPEYLIGKASR